MEIILFSLAQNHQSLASNDYWKYFDYNDYILKIKKPSVY